MAGFGADFPVECGCLRQSLVLISLLKAVLCDDDVPVKLRFSCRRSLVLNAWSMAAWLHLVLASLAVYGVDVPVENNCMADYGADFP